jgi:hypothetical protein
MTDETQGGGHRPPLPPQPAPRLSLSRKVRVTVRAPFLPDHHGHARPGLGAAAHDAKD